MRMTKEHIEDRINEMIEDIVDAERDCANATGGQYRARRAEYEATRKRVMDALIEIYIA